MAHPAAHREHMWARPRGGYIRPPWADPPPGAALSRRGGNLEAQPSAAPRGDNLKANPKGETPGGATLKPQGDNIKVQPPLVPRGDKAVANPREEVVGGRALKRKGVDLKGPSHPHPREDTKACRWAGSRDKRPHPTAGNRRQECRRRTNKPARRRRNPRTPAPSDA